MLVLFFILGAVIAALATTLTLREVRFLKREKKSLMVIHMLTQVVEGLENELEDLKKEKCGCGCSEKKAGSPQGDETVCVDKPLEEKPATKKVKARKEA